MSARVRLAATLAAAALASTACGFHGVYSLPLPGAVGTGAHTYSVGVQLADVLDLVPYSAVKVNNATVGHVRSIRLEHGHAVVLCQLRDSVRLPANAIARVDQTSLLGEKFVELEPPHDEPARGRLADGAVIPLTRTATAATVEEVLGSLSLLLNGGGVAQLHTIAHELDKALHGREGVSRDLLVQLRRFATGLDSQKAQIVKAIEGLDRLAATVRAQERALTDAVQRMPTALAVLADDRRRLTQMLGSVSRLGDVASRVIEGSRADLVTNLRNLEPTLTRLAEVGEIIPKTLEIVFTYPTADSVEHEYFGDYGNLSLTIDVSATSLLTNFGARPPGSPGTGGGGPAAPAPSSPTLPSVPSLPSAPTLPAVPPLPTPSATLPGLGAVPGMPLAFGSTAWLRGETISDLLLGVLR